MKLIKRLIIMSGKNNKGTVALERNANGVFVKYNSYGAAITSASLILAIDGKKHHHKLTGDRESFTLPDEGDASVIHAAVFDQTGLVMYGTNAPDRMTDVDVMRLARAIPVKEKKGGEVFSGRGEAVYLSEKPTKPKPAPTAKPERIEPEPITPIEPEPIAPIEPEPIKPIIEPPPASDPPVIKELPPLEIDVDNYKDEVVATENYYPEDFSFDISKVNLPKFDEDLKDDIKEIKLPKKEGIIAGYEPHKIQYNYIKKQLSALYENTPQSNITKKAEKGESIFGSSIMPDIIVNKIPPNRVSNESAQKVAAVDGDTRVEGRKSTFFEQNSERIEKLFSGERDKELEKVMPGSKWAKIKFSGDRYYVVGIIGKEFLCYGVPASYTAQPPKELEGYCFWLPILPSQPQGKGYWIMYQNLNTGETIYPSK